MKREFRQLFLCFLKCGLAGWCMEIVFTAMESAASGDLRLMGQTSLLMFPIYGLGAFLGPMSRQVDRWLGDMGRLGRRDRFWRHGLHDMVLIFTAEYAFGFLLRQAGICPWDYSGRRFSVDGLIRLDFAPFWFGAGLFFERLGEQKSR